MEKLYMWNISHSRRFDNPMYTSNKYVGNGGYVLAISPEDARRKVSDKFTIGDSDFIELNDMNLDLEDLKGVVTGNDILWKFFY